MLGALDSVIQVWAMQDIQQLDYFSEMMDRRRRFRTSTSGTAWAVKVSHAGC